MTMMNGLSMSLAAALVIVAGAAGAQEQSMEERLRAQLRLTTAQLQQAQNELERLRAGRPHQKTLADDASERDPALQDELASVRKSLAAAEGHLERERRQRQRLRREAEGSQVQAAALVDQYKAAYSELLKLARASEVERLRLTDETAFQQTALSECEAKNDALYKLGKEVIKAYEGVGVLTAVRTRQPFAAKSRARYEEVVQQYGDRLYLNKFDESAVQGVDGKSTDEIGGDTP